MGMGMGISVIPFITLVISLLFVIQVGNGG